VREPAQLLQRKAAKVGESTLDSAETPVSPPRNNGRVGQGPRGRLRVRLPPELTAAEPRVQPNICR